MQKATRPSGKRSLQLSLFVFLILLLSALGSSAGAAAYATGGSGAYRNQILWLTWGGGTNGTKNATLAEGASTSASLTLNGQVLNVTCTLSNIVAQTNSSGNPSTGGLQAYAPGTWVGDGLDDLYNIGGANTSNTLVNGIANATLNARYTFDITCTGTLNGAPYRIPGFVIADAEQSRSPEYVQGSADGTWNIIERAVNGTCVGRTYNGILSADQRTLRLAGTTTTDCSPSSTSNYGPMGVGLLTFNNSAYQGTNAQVKISVDMNGGGKSAVALGLLAAFIDFSDAPASYGTATHLFAPGFSADSLAPGATTNIAGPAFTVSSFNNTGRNALGTLEDSESNGLTLNTAATADDQTGVNDEDSLATNPPPPLYAAPGQTYTLRPSCSSTPTIQGWIDFNLNGEFDSNEASSQAVCTGGFATVNFTIPTGVKVGNSFLRLRSAFSATELTGAATNAPTGEVEDYALAITGPSVYVVKSYSPQLIPNDNATTSKLTITLGNSTTGTLTLSSPLSDNIGSGLNITSVSGGTCSAVSTSFSGTTVTYASGATVPAGGCTIIVTVKSAAAGSYPNTIPAGALTLTNGKSNTSNTNSTTSTLTVSAPADVQIAKSGPSVSKAGNTITYLLTVTNAGPGAADGTSFTDALPGNLTQVTAACQNPAGGSAGCSVSLDSSNRLSGNIGTFPSGASQEIRITATIPSGASGTFSNTASVAVPAGINDPTPTNNTSSTVTTALLDAVNDSASLNAGTGGLVNVMSNDVIGSATATPATATLTITNNGGLSGLSVSNGALSVPTNAPVGTYVVTYTLCSTQDTTVCDTATATITIVPVPDLKLVKSGPATVQPSTAAGTTTLTYTLSVSNIAATKASSGTVTVTDTLPAGLTATAISGSGWSCTLASLTCTRSDALAAGSSYPEITVIVAAPTTTSVERDSALRTFTNTATVSGGGDTSAGNNTGTWTTNVAYVKLTKQVRNLTTSTAFSSSDRGQPGDLAEFCVNYTNYSGGTPQNFTVTDAVPTNVSSVPTGYDDEEPSQATGFGIKVTRNGASSYLTSATDADSGSLTANGGTYGSGILQANLGALTSSEAGSVCFRVRIR